MRLNTLRPQTQQMLAIGVPLAAVILSVFVVYPAWGRYRAIRAEVARKSEELQNLKDAPQPPPETLLPAAEESPAEQTRFVGEINSLAVATRCQLRAIDRAGVNAESGPLHLAHVRVSLSGGYPNLRDFLWRINHGPRIYVVTDLSLGGTTGAVQANFGIERYLIPPGTPGIEPIR
jgi:hypothetical protein